jgi:hypothetical protein
MQHVDEHFHVIKNELSKFLVFLSKVATFPREVLTSPPIEVTT